MMERLTKTRNGKNVIPLLNADCGIDIPYWRIDMADDLHRYLSGYAADRLAAYEDTGLEPEICAEYKKFEDEAVSKNVPFSRIVELMEAESEGRLLVLPCNVGDTVYTAQRGVVSELSVDHFELYNVGIWVSWHLMSGIYGNFRMDGFPASDIGKTVFLTREEAEAALGKEGTSDDDHI